MIWYECWPPKARRPVSPGKVGCLTPSHLVTCPPSLDQGLVDQMLIDVIF